MSDRNCCVREWSLDTTLDSPVYCVDLYNYLVAIWDDCVSLCSQSLLLCALLLPPPLVVWSPSAGAIHTLGVWSFHKSLWLQPRVFFQVNWRFQMATWLTSLRHPLTSAPSQQGSSIPSVWLHTTNLAAVLCSVNQLDIKLVCFEPKPLYWMKLFQRMLFSWKYAYLQCICGMSRKSLNKRITSGHVLRLHPPMQFALRSSECICIGLYASACVCTRLWASASICVHLRASAYVRERSRASHRKV